MRLRLKLSTFTPRYGLRTMLAMVLVIAVSIPLVQTGWRMYVRYREGREYSTLQATKDAFVEKAKRRRAGSTGISLAIDESRPVPDDFVVLVRRGDLFGCFIPRKQNQKGESLEYDWFYRTDGGGRFASGDPKVRSGSSFAGPYRPGSGRLVTVAFGPFEIEWSGNGKGWGFLYYESSASSAPSSANLHGICTTDHKTVDYIDARSPEWTYKAYVGDAGQAGDFEGHAETVIP